MPAADALTAVLVYRVISYVLIAALGWVVIMVMFRSGIRDGETMDEEIEHDLSRSGADSADADATDAGSESSESSERSPSPWAPEFSVTRGSSGCSVSLGRGR